MKRGFPPITIGDLTFDSKYISGPIKAAIISGALATSVRKHQWQNLLFILSLKLLISFQISYSFESNCVYVVGSGSDGKELCPEKK